MTRDKILIVDPETEGSQVLSLNLNSNHFQVLAVRDGASALAMARERLPSLIVLDVALPDISGFEVCRQLQADSSTRHIQIVILSAQATEQDRIRGFELGADDYIAKSCTVREVVLRIQKSLDRMEDIPAPPTQQKMVLGDLVLDPARHEVTLQEEIVHLTPIEFRLLAFLMGHQGCAVDRENILRKIWNQSKNPDTRTIDAHIKRLRQKLGHLGRAIETITGFGYRLNQSLAPSSHKVDSTPIELNELVFAINRMDVGKTRMPNRKKSLKASLALK